MFSPWEMLSERFASVLAGLGSARPARVAHLRSSSLFFFVHYLARQEQQAGTGRPLLLLTETTANAWQYRQFLADVARLVDDREPEPGEYLVYPDFEPQSLFDYSDPPTDILEARNQALDGLYRGTARAVVASYKACWRLLPPPEHFGERELQLQTGTAPRNGDGALDRIGRDQLVARLESLGYSHVTTVVEVGEYAVRGGLVDVYPAGAKAPIRIDLFGDEIEDIAEFDPETQRSTGSIGACRILGVGGDTALLADESNIGWLTDTWTDFAQRNRETMSKSTLKRLEEVVYSDLEAMEQGSETSRAGWYAQAIASRDCCLWHYLPEDSQVIVHEDGFVDSETSSFFRFWNNRFGDWLRNGLSFLTLGDFYLEPGQAVRETVAQLASGSMIVLGSNEGSDARITAPRLAPLITHSFDVPASATMPSASAGLDSPPAGKWGTTHIADTVAALPQLPAMVPDGDLNPTVNRSLTILSQFSARLREILSEAELTPEIQNAILPGGFVIPEEWTVITDMEIFGDIAEVSQAVTRRYHKQALRRTDDLKPGDYVVHIDYGIGRFAQLTQREISGIEKTFVEVEYAGRDRLFVPVDQLDRLRRYSYDESEPQLNHLGRETWKKTKEKVQRDTLELAKKLLSLYRSRMLKHGFAFGPSTTWQDEFADGFPYRLTEDQLAAWRDVEKDMEADKPMDRLVCGDVGFGKTEVAMRAAFKACVEEKQVLVLCPTTVLADQHFRTFTRRFKPFPFKVGLLSRFQTKAEQQDTLDKMRTARVDVVIATHRALSKDVEFGRLGLLVVDEEQRFGVKQKEALKMRWPEVDVLSMTATPIPRTLHMSLIGIRDISLIETAPVARKPVKTYVGEHDELLIKEALVRELGRGGQIYYLHNKVQDIEKVHEQIESLIPEQKVIIGHGQMREDRLEEVMHAFSLGAYKVLLATTIIENGLDIPSVNTIVVDNAENLGLAQMHQLRGRVGRSAAQAYAYFFHSPNRVLTEEAQNRLHAIYNYAYLGAGYEIAQSDLRIRGAGNLLGAAQSGLAKQVGFEYYCELLARSVSDIKALDEADIEEWEDRPLLAERPGTQIDMPLPAYIPEEYIDDPVLRLDLLREIAALDSDDAVEQTTAELADRFGPLPSTVHNLLSVIKIKNLASHLGLERLNYDRLSDAFTLKFFEDEPDWYKRAPLVDSRFSPGRAPATLQLAMAFEPAETPRELHETLESLASAKPVPQKP